MFGILMPLEYDYRLSGISKVLKLKHTVKSLSACLPLKHNQKSSSGSDTDISLSVSFSPPVFFNTLE